MAHSSKNISLAEYLEEVDKSIVLIPKFQRNFVWNKTQMIKLAASILKGYPIGSFLLMQNTGDYASRKIEGIEREETQDEIEENQENTLLILDGQQRTTSAYQIFYGKGKYRFYFNFNNFIKSMQENNGEDVENLIEDNLEEWIEVLEEKQRIDNSDEQRAKGLFPLDSILQGKGATSYTRWIDTFSRTYATNKDHTIDEQKDEEIAGYKEIFIRELVESVISYQASEIIIDKRTSSNIVCTIFETINSTGQKLTILDLLNAKCFPYGFKLSEEIDNLIEQEEIFKEFNKEKEELIGLSIIRIIGLLCKKSSKRSDLLALKAPEIKEYWEEAVHSLKYALEYIGKEFGVLGVSTLPYKDMLPVISVIINSSEFKESPKNARKLECWYWNAIFSGYFDNATETKNIKVIKELLGNDKEKGWFENDELVPQMIKLFNISSLEDLDEVSSVRSARYKAIHNLILLNGAEDFSKGRVKLIEMKENQLQDHHIFPKKFLSHYKLKGKDVNTILNRTMISAKANLTIKDEQPQMYMVDAKRVGMALQQEELEKHLIDKQIIMQDFKVEVYKLFKEKRKEKIINLIREKVEYQ